MTLTRLLVDAGTVAADGYGFSAVVLGWRHEPDAAVAVLVVVPIYECRHPGAGLLEAAERPVWVVRPVLTAPLDFVDTARNNDSEYGLSFLTLGLEMDLSTASFSSRLSSVAARMALPLSAWRIRG